MVHNCTETVLTRGGKEIKTILTLKCSVKCFGFKTAFKSLFNTKGDVKLENQMLLT